MYLLREILGSLFLIAISPAIVLVAFIKVIIMFIIGGLKSLPEKD